mmetsp:Transcript_105059/g.266892  ORF Transcript_105059/g.266892 Transcript_105059/m.266892 type:complete len:239 (+) Transcript_105059:120-836(+)
MVIPMGGMGAGMAGPFPAELDHRFRQLKRCVLAMLLSALGVIVFMPMCFNANVFSVILSSLNIVLNAIFGIWMLQQDPLIGRMYHCLTTTICQPCGEQCQGGLQCLMPFMFGNGITVFLNIIQPGDLVNVFGNIGKLFKPMEWKSGLWGFWFVFYAACVLTIYISQISGIVFGYLAYKQVRDAGVTVSGGSWTQGGGGAPARQGPAGGDDASQSAPEGRPAQQNFQAFGGQGQRLGSG